MTAVFITTAGGGTISGLIRLRPILSALSHHPARGSSGLIRPHLVQSGGNLGGNFAREDWGCCGRWRRLSLRLQSGLTHRRPPPRLVRAVLLATEDRRRADQEGDEHARLICARSRLVDAQVRGVEIQAERGVDRPMHRTRANHRQLSDRLRHRLQKPIPVSRRQGAGCVHDGGQFVVAQTDRLRH